MYGARFKDLPGGVSWREYETFLSVLRAFLSVSHNEDGTQIATTQEWTLGPWVLGTADTRDDPVWVRAPSAIPTGTYNDWGPPGLAGAVVLSISATGGNLTFTGLQAPEPEVRQMILLRNEDNTSDVILKHENTGSSAKNRFRLPNSTDLTLNPNESCWLLRDPKWLRWSVAGMV